MTGLGMLEAQLSLREELPSERIAPARPGGPAAGLFSRGAEKSTPLHEHVEAEIRRETVSARDRAARRVAASRTSTTLTALAQSLIALNEVDEAEALALSALELSVRANEHGEPQDPHSAKLATEVLVACGQGEAAFNLLRTVPSHATLSLTYAAIAASLGQTGEASRVLKNHEGSAAASFRGYLAASQGQYQQAIGHLRTALRAEPNDADALLNLSISLWSLGAASKATRAALRAARTAPGRKDISLHYLELLLAQGHFELLSSEVARLQSSGVVADAGFLAIQARMSAATGNLARAVQLFDRAAAQANKQGDLLEEGASWANHALLRYRMGRISRQEAVDRFRRLLRDFPRNDAIAINYAEVARTPADAAPLAAVLEDLVTTPVRRAFLLHHVSFLTGDNAAAATAAADWFELDRGNPAAATAAMVAIGIGVERWGEAAIIADFAISAFPENTTVINNAAYVLAMSGRAREAICLLEPLAGESFVLEATLGLACLANNEVERGMKLYRSAADKAEKVDDLWRTLMTFYQALVVRQLHLGQSTSEDVLMALALPGVGLPADWREHPDFLRLYEVCRAHGYEWPLEV